MSEAENQTGFVERDLSQEKYSQIASPVLAMFPRRSCPLNLFQHEEEESKESQLFWAHMAGDDITPDKWRELDKLCKQQRLFFSRKQIDIYINCVKLDVELLANDPNVAWEDKIGLILEGLRDRQEDLFSQPLAAKLEALKNLLNSFVFSILNKPSRLGVVLGMVHDKMDREHQRVNASLLAFAIFLHMKKDKTKIEGLCSTALGLFLYDIGMNKISTLITGQSRILSTEERRKVQDHPRLGFDIATRLGVNSTVELEAIIQHHERLDGTGYPTGLTSERIGLLGRIAAVADSYTAMITDRPHCSGRVPLEAAKDLLSKENKYDRRVSEALVRFLLSITSAKK